MFKDKQEEKFYREAVDTFCDYSDPNYSFSKHMWKAGCDYTKEKLIAMGWTPPGEKQAVQVKPDPYLSELSGLPVYTEAPAVAHPSADVVRELMSAYGSTRMSLQMFSATFDKCGFVPSEATKNLVDRALHSIDSALKSAKEHGL